MIIEDDKKRHNAREVALLGIFALGLLIAYMLVAHRSRITLSEPIKLEPVGISVSMPTNTGWQRNSKWQIHRQRNAILTGRLNLGGHTDTAKIVWIYKPSREMFNMKDYLTTLADSYHVKTMDYGHFRVSSETLEWIQAGKKGSAGDTFLGVVQLGNRGIIEISVHAPADPTLAGRIFQKVARSLTIEQKSEPVKKEDITKKQDSGEPFYGKDC